MKNQHIVAFSGGVGGAKLVLGLSQVLATEQLSVLANTADDFEHLGLYIAPDLDSVMYALAGINNQKLGWGIKDETWQCMSAMERLQGETWFSLGDQDIATHLLRTQSLKQGKSLSETTADLFQRLGIQHTIMPMCDEKVSTVVHTEEGGLAFQHYFVKRQCQPKVSGFHFDGIEQASLGAAQKAAIAAMDALIICPSNPFVSVAPILAVPGMRDAIKARSVPVVVVSPIIAGNAVKGPAAKMMQELDMPVTALAIAEYYRDIASHFVLDSQDAEQQAAIEALGYKVLTCNTLMRNDVDKTQLAKTILSSLHA